MASLYAALFYPVVRPVSAEKVTIIPVETPQADDVETRQLPNECAIIATEAYERLRVTGVWVRLVHMELLIDGVTSGHMVVAWQPSPNSPMMFYDDNLFRGTMTIPVSDRNLNSACPILNSLLPSNIRIVRASYIE